MIRGPSAFLTLLLLSACAPPPLPDPLPAAGLPGPRRGGTLRYSLEDEPRTLDPATAFDEISASIEHYLFDTLVGYAPPGAPDPLALVPQLAESYTISADGLLYSFTLRADLHYDDGTPIVADDFVFALERVLTPGVGSGGAPFYTAIAGAPEMLAGTATHAAGLRAVDARHLEIQLTQPEPDFLMILAMKFATPVPRAHAAARGQRLNDTPLASGPFRLASWQHGALMIFERNPHYWDDAHIYLDRIELSLFVPREVAAFKLLRGELDMAERLPADLFVQFVHAPRWQPYLHQHIGMNTVGELMDVTRPPFSDKRVRQAMNYAIDKQSAVILMNGRVAIAHGLYPPGLPGYDASIPPYPYDPDKARALLAEAGYPHGFEVTYTITRDEQAQKISQSIQADLAKVGVTVHIQLLTFPAYLTAAGRHELQFAFTGWQMDFPDPSDFIEPRFHSRSISAENSTNDTGYSNPELDRLLDAAHVETDPARRLAMYHQAELILHDDCPWVWHYHDGVSEAVQPYVKDYLYHPVWTRGARHVWLDKPDER